MIERVCSGIICAEWVACILHWWSRIITKPIIREFVLLKGHTRAFNLLILITRTRKPGHNTHACFPLSTVIAPEQLTFCVAEA
jgi:hypothetical protein